MMTKYLVPAAMAAVLGGLAAPAHAAIAETTANDGDIHLIYVPASGNLTVAVNGLAYGTVQLAATTAVFTAGTAGTSPEYYEGDTGLDLGFGVLTGTQTADVVLPGVLLKNLSESTLLSAISVTAVTQGPATSKFSFSGGTTATTPEPASLALVGLGAAGAMRRRQSI